MQNNVTELTQKLLAALDNDYNVKDMHQVVDVISQLEKLAITKELLETTRLGKYVNELRRKTTNQELWRRAKELLKKWRSMVLPEANGQIKTPGAQPPPVTIGKSATPNKASPPLQGQSLNKSRVSPVPPKKVSPPISNMVSPALQNRLVSPGVQRLVSPALQGRLVSPKVQKKLVSPRTNIGPLAPKLVSPHAKMGTHSMQQLVSPHKMVSSGGQRISPKLAAQAQGQISPPLQNADVNLNQLKTKKRPANDITDSSVTAKRSRFNGGVTDLDFSDSSNSSFKDAMMTSLTPVKPETKRDVISANSDSNSSFHERAGDSFDLIPKKRGRKKGSKNHKNLLDEAETSFTNKLAVSASRGSSKVKTTQEILAGIQNKNSVALGVASGLKPSKEDLEEKAAKLTERVSIIDRKLNANAHRNKNSQKNKMALSSTLRPNERVIESGSVINDKSLLERIKKEEFEDEEDEEIVVVDDEASADSHTEESQETDPVTGLPLAQDFGGVKSLSIEEALAQLPLIDKSVLDEVDGEPSCSCRLIENKPNDFSIGEEDENEQPPPFEIVEDPDCPAQEYLEHKYRVQDVSQDKLSRLQDACLPNINGNWSLGTPRPEAAQSEGLYLNIVPSIYERLDKDVRPFDSYKKYSVSKADDSDSAKKTSASEIKTEEIDQTKPEDNSDKSDIRTEEKEVFREWYECVDTPSYNGDTLRILPYCVVD